MRLGNGRFQTPSRSRNVGATRADLETFNRRAFGPEAAMCQGESGVGWSRRAALAILGAMDAKNELTRRDPLAKRGSRQRHLVAVPIDRLGALMQEETGSVRIVRVDGF
jgi:hypothetical protein